MGYEKYYGEKMSAERVQQVTMSKVYGWMTLALMVSALTAVYTASSEAMLSLILGSKLRFVGLGIAEVALVVYVSARISRLSFSTAAALFGLYAVLNGVTMSVILLAYSASTIYAAFFSTGLTFGVMSFVGYTTNRDLTAIGSFLLMALVGLIIATLVNLFFHFTWMESLITYAGLFIFVGLTAYDTQNVKNALAYSEAAGIAVDTRKIALMGALSLYLDFVNLFLYILRLLGGRRG
ncbi:MAG: Bax inhibitor-1/YccA family protein [Bacteroidaceae bacterium]|nr:Bax inhibitor-1/YccA family protein [Bacteroidaceae bacterium]